MLIALCTCEATPGLISSGIVFHMKTVSYLHGSAEILPFAIQLITRQESIPFILFGNLASLNYDKEDVGQSAV